MQLVCKIPDELYKKWEQSKFTLDEAYQFVDCVMNGKPLDSVLDEIMAEIPKLVCCENEYRQALVKVADVIKCIDKYRAESEDKECQEKKH